MFNGCDVGSAEAPIIVHAAGIPAFSTNALSSVSALLSIIPCPQIINGFLALFMRAAAAEIEDGSVFGTGT